MDIEHKMKVSNNTFHHTLLILLVAAVYFFAARWGLLLATINNSASPVWPATGVALFAILVGGPWMGIGVFLGAFGANYLTDAPLPVVFAIGVGNTLEALTGVWIFHTFSKANARLGPHAKLINYVAVATLASIVSSSIGSLSLYFANSVSSSELRDTWLTWWVGDTLGALILFPIAVLVSRNEFSLLDITIEKVGKLAVTLTLPLGLGAFVFGTSIGPPFLFVIFLSLLLAALWFSASWIYFTSVVICALSVIYTKNNLGPFTGGLLNENLLHLQLFLAGIGLTAIMLASLRQEGFLKSPSLALLFGWLLTGMAFYSFYHSSTRNDANYFARQTDEAAKALQEHLNNYTRMLESGAALFAASEEVSGSDWRAFVGHLRFETQYPGIEGIGVIVPAKNKEDLEILISAQRKNGFPDFKLTPVVAAEDFTVKNPPFHLIVKYIEPLESNKKAIGLDASSEKRRLAGALKALDSGVPSISDQITLVQDVWARSGFILFAPFYQKNLPINTLEERRASFQGLVYAPVVVEKFVLSALKSFNREIDLKMFFGNEPLLQYQVYASTADQHGWEHSKKSEIKLAGQPVTLLWKHGPAFKPQSSLVASWVGFCGALMSIFLGILLSSLEHLTERAQKIAEQKNYELSQREGVWRALSESSPVGIYLCDDQGVTTYINPTFSKLLGRSFYDIMKVGWAEFIHPEDRDRILQGWAQYQLAPQGNFNCNFRFVADSKVLHVASDAVPLRNENGLITGFVGTIQDLTELHLKQMALMASSRMSSLGEMAGGVAHEINNPLAIIAGKAQHLDFLVKQESLDTSKAQSHIQVIKSNVERIAKIIKGLRTIARDVPDDPILEVRAKDILQDTLELCRSRFKHHEISLFVPVIVEDNMKCLARPEQIVQVLLNLLNNAFDAVSTLDEKWVKVDVCASADKIQFSVTDSGKELNHDLQEQIFVPFFTTKEVGKGTGLGLSISRSIIEKHNGRLYLDADSVNTKFVIELNTRTEQSIST